MTDDATLPTENGPERTCIVTRQKGDPGTLLRFVVAPDGTVMFDVRRRLPGRGAWLMGQASVVETAIKRKAFARAFKRDVGVSGSLPAEVDELLLKDALQSLALANKAGQVVAGSAKVQGALGDGKVAALLHATNASPDGSRKIEASARRAAGETSSPPVVQMFESHQMDLALGRANVIHAALLIGGASDAFLERAARLSRFRGSDPRRTAGSMGGSLPDSFEADATSRDASVSG